MPARSPKKTGGWKNIYHRGAFDSSMRTEHANYQTRYDSQFYSTQLARVQTVNREPSVVQAAVNVITSNGSKISQCMWPGPNVEVSESGEVSDTVTQIHGLYVSPQEGQAVILGFQDSCSKKPVVLNVYPTYCSQNPDLKDFHTTPMTKANHDADDIVLGHFSNAYIALRARTLPGQVDINGESKVVINAKIGFDTISKAYIKMTADTSVEIEASTTLGLKSTTSTSIEADTSMKIKSTEDMNQEAGTSYSLKSSMSMKMDAGTSLDVTVGSNYTAMVTGSLSMSMASGTISSDGSLDISGSVVSLTATSGALTLGSSSGTVTVQGVSGSPEPAVKGIQLTTFILNLYSYLLTLIQAMATETHTSNFPGFPTSRPLNAPVYLQVATNLAAQLANVPELLSTSVLLT